LKATPAAQAVLDAINVLREMNSTGARKLPDDVPVTFIKARWKPLVISDEGLDRRFYEICVLSELKNSLRSGDIWVQDSGGKTGRLTREGSGRYEREATLARSLVRVFRHCYLDV
jgi:hypothetical protein